MSSPGGEHEASLEVTELRRQVDALRRALAEEALQQPSQQPPGQCPRLHGRAVHLCHPLRTVSGDAEIGCSGARYSIIYPLQKVKAKTLDFFALVGYTLTMNRGATIKMTRNRVGQLAQARGWDLKELLGRIRDAGKDRDISPDTVRRLFQNPTHIGNWASIEILAQVFGVKPTDMVEDVPEGK